MATPGSSAPDRRRALDRPAGSQLADYALAAVLVLGGLHTSGPLRVVMLVGAGALAALAAMTKGPLAAFPRLGPRAHRVLVVVLGVALVASPPLVRHHLDALGVAVTGAVGLALVWLSLRRRAPAPQSPQASPPARTSPEESASHGASRDEVGHARRLGRIVGMVVRAGRAAR